jgi:phage terminase large subunit-like protein
VTSLERTSLEDHIEVERKENNERLDALIKQGQAAAIAGDIDEYTELLERIQYIRKRLLL